MSALRPLPGVTFVARPPALPDLLPRMDVAAFVGFAAAGPLDTPVPVEDEVHFREIFGDDLPLAWDPKVGAYHYAYLGPAVRAFFRNGGRRCWVVRVAAGAVTNQFRVPGLVRTPLPEVPLPESPPPTPETAVLWARSEGAWSDHLQVGTSLQSSALAGASFAAGVLVIAQTARERISVGDLLRLTFAAMDATEPATVLFLAVDAVETVDRTWRISGQEFYFQAVDGLLQPLSTNGRAAVGGAQPLAAERLTFTLWAEDGNGLRLWLAGLGFSSQHPRFVGLLPSDQQLLQLDQGPLADGSPPGQQLWVEATSPRFPLAADGETQVYLPLNMDALPTQAHFVGPVSSAASVPVRNGLAAFSPDLFVDPDLAPIGVGALPGEAFHKRYVRGEALQRLHALWPLAEVTLVSLPDAVHPTWAEVAAVVEPLLAAPVLAPLTAAPAVQDAIATWQTVAHAEGYLVQHGADMAFQTDVVTLRFTVAPTNQPATMAAVVHVADPDCPHVRYVRVAARRGQEHGPWSVTRFLRLPHLGFQPAHAAGLSAPDLPLPTAVGDGRYAFAWGGQAGDRFTLQEASEPDFTSPVDLLATAVDLADGQGTGITVTRSGDVSAYYRLRLERGGAVSPWSATVTIQATDPGKSWELQPFVPADGEGLLGLHSILLRFAAARADVLGVLTLPVHYREVAAVTHARHLAAAMGDDDGLTLSYGALYHPWTWIQESTRPTYITPPDGTVTGQLAARAMQRGAWVAPANVAMAGVVALEPDLAAGGKADVLFQEQVNLIQRDPRGFLLLGADTLSSDRALRPIGVRRLLSLLRRLALQEGASLVFEPNNPAFARMVQRQFESVMAELFQRGAFAGTTPAESYQVAVGPSVNTPTSLEQGRFVVELRVAPSQPLVFLTVRLVQSQSGGPAATEG